MNNLRIFDDFPGSMIGQSRIEGSNVYVELKKDPLTKGYLEWHDYNLHFNFGIRNESKKELDVSFFIGCKGDNELNQPFSWVWIINDLHTDSKKTSINGRMRVPGKYFFILRIPPGEMRISNYIPFDHSKIIKNIKILSNTSGVVEKSIGKSVEGRNISVYEYIKYPNLPYLVFISGFHPPENDVFACEAITELLTEKSYREEILKKFNISLIPLVNPDGYVNNSQGSNANGVNFYWKFHGNSVDMCPESHAIWSYMKTIKPLFYMDFHAFTFQNYEPRPYTIPPMIHSNMKRAKIQNEINSILSKDCGLKYKLIHHYLTPAKILAPDLLSTSLFNEFGTIISPKFHVHVKYGINSSKELIKKCVKDVFNLFLKNNKIEPVNKGLRVRVLYKFIFLLNRAIFFIR